MTPAVRSSREPENKTPYLPSRGAPRWTWHTYVRTEAVADDDGVGYAFYFRCNETGAERVFGLEGPPAVEA